MSFSIESAKRQLDSVMNCGNESVKLGYIKCGEHAIKQLRDGLPALNDSDLAVVAWFIAELTTQLRETPVKLTGEILTDTSVGYALATSRLLGLT